MENIKRNLTIYVGWSLSRGSLKIKSINSRTRSDIAHIRRFNERMFKRSTRFRFVYTGSHHKGISVLYLTQNLFPPGKLSRTISLNSHYFIIFKNPRDSLGIATLAKQMFPNRTQYLMDSFHDATKEPFSYLLIDCHPQTPETIRLRTNIFPGERHIVYVPK